jgi:beta-phosphoglucomutase-like phosphatase (HAD superfamily)
MKLEALIFDVDGTLADTEEAHRCAFNEAFEQLGIAWNWSRPTYAHLLSTTGGKERLAAHIDSLDASAGVRQGYMRRIEEIHRAKTRNYTRSVHGGRVPLRDGVLRLLDEAARSRVRVCIASTTTFANIEALLHTHLGESALDRFAVIGAGDRPLKKKPAPDIYDYVRQRLGASPDACVAIEDSANGLRAAKAAGLFTLVTPSYWTRTEDFSGADLVLPSLGSPERPLMPRAVSLLGNSMVGIREINRHLSAVSDLLAH